MSVVRGAGILAVAVVVGYLVRRLATRALQRRGVTDSGSASAVIQLIQYGLLAIGIIVALQTAGINLSALVAAGAFFAAAVGFALQGLAQDFLAGVALMVERSVTAGDLLELDGRVVRVQRIGIRAIVARGRDDVDLIIPNRLLVQSTIANYTRRDDLFRLRTTIGIHYQSDLDRVVEVLTAGAASVPGQASTGPAPLVLLTEFGASAVEFEISIWINDPWSARVRKSDLNFAAWRALRRAGITIAYPQLDVHLRGQGILQPPNHPAGPSVGSEAAI